MNMKKILLGGFNQYMYKRKKCPNCKHYHKVKVIENIELNDEHFNSFMMDFAGILETMSMEFKNAAKSGERIRVGRKKVPK